MSFVRGIFQGFFVRGRFQGFFVRGRFQGFFVRGRFHCSNLKFDTMIYVYEYNRNILEMSPKYTDAPSCLMVG